MKTMLDANSFPLKPKPTLLYLVCFALCVLSLLKILKLQAQLDELLLIAFGVAVA